MSPALRLVLAVAALAVAAAFILQPEEPCFTDACVGCIDDCTGGTP